MILLLSLEYSSTSPYFFVLPLSEAPVMSVILFEEGSLLVSQNWIAAQLVRRGAESETSWANIPTSSPRGVVGTL